jgi:hypothetical protein
MSQDNAQCPDDSDKLDMLSCRQTVIIVICTLQPMWGLNRQIMHDILNLICVAHNNKPL